MISVAWMEARATNCFLPNSLWIKTKTVCSFRYKVVSIQFQFYNITESVKVRAMRIKSFILNTQTSVQKFLKSYTINISFILLSIQIMERNLNIQILLMKRIEWKIFKTLWNLSQWTNRKKVWILISNILDYPKTSKLSKERTIYNQTQALYTDRKHN